MTWSFHNYFNDKKEGLLSHLRLSSEEKRELKGLRRQVRRRIRCVFEEAKSLLQSRHKESITQLSFSKSFFRYLKEHEQIEFASLINELDSEALEAFLKLEPRFMTQGSFKYGTLNRPYWTPPQEMDIDDGTYLPMAIFEGKPVIGHRLLQLLVDTSLKSLEQENPGWIFDPSLDKCGRIKVSSKHVHIDVPMYAIPVKQFEEKELAMMEALSRNQHSIHANAFNFESESVDYNLDTSSVNLLVRNGEKRWIISDPKIVEDWFKSSCNRIGNHLKAICCILKAWRDANWISGGGPSSISLMAATVKILDENPIVEDDFGSVIKLVASALPGEFRNGVESPDYTDEKPLFPSEDQHEEKHNQIILKLEEFHMALLSAEQSESKNVALDRINSVFGHRVTNAELIVSVKASAAYKQAPQVSKKPQKISESMQSG